MSLDPFRVRIDAELVIFARNEPFDWFCVRCDFRYGWSQIETVEMRLGGRPTLGEIADRLRCWCGVGVSPRLHESKHRAADRMEEFRLTATRWTDTNREGRIEGVRMASIAKTPMIYRLDVWTSTVTLRPWAGKTRKGSPHFKIDGAALARVMDGLLERAPVDSALGPRGRWEGRL